MGCMGCLISEASTLHYIEELGCGLYWSTAYIHLSLMTPRAFIDIATAIPRSKISYCQLNYVSAVRMFSRPNQWWESLFSTHIFQVTIGHSVSDRNSCASIASLVAGINSDRDSLKKKIPGAKGNGKLLHYFALYISMNPTYNIKRGTSDQSGAKYTNRINKSCICHKPT